MPLSESTKIAVMQSDLGYIKKSVDSMTDTLRGLDGKFATKSELVSLKEMVEGISSAVVYKVEFWPVKAIVFGGAGLVLIGVLAAIVLVATNGTVRIQK